MYRLGLETLYALSLHRLLAPLCSGAGVIFTLHHVRPAAHTPFAPNAFLEVTPEFLGIAIGRVKALGLDLVGLEEARQRIVEKSSRRFACFTLDDGYRDNLLHGLPVFEAHGCPFTVFATTSFVDGTGEIYWKGLEAAISVVDKVVAEVGGRKLEFCARTTDDKLAAYREILRASDAVGETEKRAAISTLCRQHGIDMGRICRELVMTWDEVRSLARHPLAAIGAHTVNHFALKRLSDEAARDEIEAGAARIEREIGYRPTAFAYPYGSASEAGEREFELVRQAGFRVGVTTRPGVLRHRDASRLEALPRVSLNGLYQRARFVDVLASGVPFALLDNARKLTARRY